MSWRASAATSSLCCSSRWATPRKPAALADRVVACHRKLYEIDGHQVIVGATIGIAMAPRDGDNADHLLKNADMALYRAKAEGRGTWRFFEQEMDTRRRRGATSSSISSRPR